MIGGGTREEQESGIKVRIAIERSQDGREFGRKGGEEGWQAG